jgi:glycosyltransferase involved in cell wall biosynthesis
MKVVLVNTLASGGAYVACKRLKQALQRNGVDASLIEIKAKRWNFLWERFCIWVANHFSRKNLFAVSIANTGTDISKLDVVREADIIHLHWINQGGLSLHNIEQSQALGKPIVWTMHDMWPFTGICHHANECTQYRTKCLSCPKNANILARKIFDKKQSIWQHLTFIGCSKWISSLAEKSRLTGNSQVFSIPNPIDTTLLKPIAKAQAKQQLGLDPNVKYILFGAVNSIAPAKGVEYLLRADQLLTTKKIQYLVLGKNGKSIIEKLTHEGVDLGYISDDSLKNIIYSAADVFVTPSLEENLPNMIMEAMACGTPCVGFNIGGIPEMIDHKQNGYVAQYKDALDFARGINWVLSSQEDLGTAARTKVTNVYAESVVANQYIQLYQSLLKK